VEAYDGKTSSLGERRYLEIIAPDPAQPRSADVRQLYRHRIAAADRVGRPRRRSGRRHDDQGGLLPFFIEWAKDSPHPSTDAPAGARLDRFELGSPRPTDLHATVSRLDLDASVAKAAKPERQAAVTGPKGTLSLPA
jgi:hypothetical protein